jgi:hypothetical protein
MLQNMTPEEQTSFLEFQKRLDESYRSMSSAAKSDVSERLQDDGLGGASESMAENISNLDGFSHINNPAAVPAS